MVKIKYAREEKDYGTYKNLIRALADITTLKQKEISNLPNKPYKSTYNLYYDIERYEGANGRCTIYFKDSIHGVVGDYKFISEYIENLCKDEKVIIHGDINALGLGLADYLMELGYLVSPTTMHITDVTRNISKEYIQNYSELRNLDKI